MSGSGDIVQTHWETRTAGQTGKVIQITQTRNKLSHKVHTYSNKKKKLVTVMVCPSQVLTIKTWKVYMLSQNRNKAKAFPDIITSKVE